MNYILGTAQLGLEYGINNIAGKPLKDEVFSILSLAYDSGLFLDTARDYGDSEALIGEFVDKTGSEFKLCSKYSGDGKLLYELQATLDALSTDRLYLYYLHRFEDCLQSSIIDELIHLKESGLIERIGVSVYTPEELRYISQNLNGVADVVQIPFSIVDCSRWMTTVEDAAANGVDIFCRSVFLQGAVLKTPDDAFIQSYNASEHLSFISELCDKYSSDVGRLAFSFCQSFEGISGLIFGCETLAQLEQNLQVLQNPIKISDSDIKLIIEKMESIDSNFIDPRTWEARSSL